MELIDVSSREPLLSQSDDFEDLPSKASPPPPVYTPPSAAAAPGLVAYPVQQFPQGWALLTHEQIQQVESAAPVRSYTMQLILAAFTAACCGIGWLCGLPALVLAGRSNL